MNGIHTTEENMSKLFCVHGRAVFQAREDNMKLLLTFLIVTGQKYIRSMRSYSLWNGTFKYMSSISLCFLSSLLCLKNKQTKNLNANSYPACLCAKLNCWWFMGWSGLVLWLVERRVFFFFKICASRKWKQGPLPQPKKRIIKKTAAMIWGEPN